MDSYLGWKYGFSEYSDMYMKRRKRAPEVDVDKLKADLKEELKQEVLSHFQEMLAANGLHIVLICSTPSAGGARNSTGASQNGCDGHNEDNEIVMGSFNDDRKGNNDEPDSIDGLTEPTPCALVSYVGGYRQEVARGLVHPGQTVVHTVRVGPDCAVVQVDFVHAGHENDQLPVIPNDEITTLGEARLQRIQWKRSHIVLQPPPLDAPHYGSSPPCNISAQEVNVQPGKEKSPKQRENSGRSKANTRDHKAPQKVEPLLERNTKAAEKTANTAEPARNGSSSKPSPLKMLVGNKVAKNKMVDKSSLEKKPAEKVPGKSSNSKVKSNKKSLKQNQVKKGQLQKKPEERSSSADKVQRNKKTLKQNHVKNGQLQKKPEESSSADKVQSNKEALK
ncbi:hypothetical protein EJB05_00304, partial [Eragrostis curvula]